MKKEDRELIKQYVTRNSAYSFTVNEHYCIPTYVKSSTGEYVDLRNCMSQAIRTGNSKYTRRFKRDLDNIIKSSTKEEELRLFRYSQEFPVPIEDLDLWAKVLYMEHLDIKDYPEFHRRRFFLLDFFFFYPGLVIEIDSDFHDYPGRRRYDQARDRYIKMKYGLETYRIEKYGDSDVLDRYSIEYVRDVILEKTTNNYYYNSSYYSLDFSDTMIDTYVNFHKGIFEFIDNLRSYLKNLFDRDVIVLTRIDLERLDPYNFVISLRRDQEKLYTESISNVLWEIYGKELHIIDTRDYSIGDVLRILELLQTGQFSWDDFLGRSIPKWLIYMAGLPPMNLTNKSLPENLRISLPLKDSLDGDISKFLDLLVKAGIILPSEKPGNSYT